LVQNPQNSGDQLWILEIRLREIDTDLRHENSSIFQIVNGAQGGMQYRICQFVPQLNWGDGE